MLGMDEGATAGRAGAASQKPIAMSIPVVERAFQLASIGELEELQDIRRQLESEGYFDVQEHLECPLLRQQLRSAARAARKEEITL